MSKKLLFILLVVFIFIVYVLYVNDDVKDSQNNSGPAYDSAFTSLPSPTCTPVPAPTPLPVPSPVMKIEPEELFPGTFFTIYLSNVIDAQMVSVTSGASLGKTKFFNYEDGMVSLVPVDYRSPWGVFDIKASVIGLDGKPYDIINSIKVMEKRFPEQRLIVSKEQQEKRTNNNNLQNDYKQTSQARAQTDSKPLWEGNFVIPLDGPITSEFGLVRFVNGIETGRHSGLDISAVTGTDIKAANSGNIVLAMELIITGKTVIIDHGMNVFSAYSHLDSISVNKGDRVKKEDVIGKVGSTGFSTGPHLHWTVSLGKTFIDPRLLVEKEPLSLN